MKKVPGHSESEKPHLAPFETKAELAKCTSCSGLKWTG